MKSAHLTWLFSLVFVAPAVSGCGDDALRATLDDAELRDGLVLGDASEVSEVSEVDAGEDTGDEDTAPPEDTAAPDTRETTGPDTTAPDTIEPDTTEPIDTAPDTIEPDTAAPDTVAPDTTAPDTTVPDTTVPDTTPVDTEPVATDPAPAETTAPDDGSLGGNVNQNPPAGQQGAGLARTGTDLKPYVLVGAALVVVGAFALASSGRLRRRTDHDVMQQHTITTRLRLPDQPRLSPAAERALDGKTSHRCNKRPRLLQQQTSRPERTERGVERRESPRHLTADIPVHHPAG